MPTTMENCRPINKTGEIGRIKKIDEVIGYAD